MDQKIVYALSHPVTGEVRYIGKSERGLIRPRQHGMPSSFRRRGHLPLVRWIKKLRDQGLDYVIEVVEGRATREELNEAERFYIAYFRSLGFRLLNLCNGGEGFTGRHTEESKRRIGAGSVKTWIGRRHSEESKQRMRVSKLGRPNPRTAKPHSEERKIRNSRAQGGKPFQDQHGNVYQTQSEAARKLGLFQPNIRKVLLGKRSHTGGYRFTHLPQS